MYTYGEDEMHKEFWSEILKERELLKEVVDITIYVDLKRLMFKVCGLDKEVPLLGHSFTALLCVCVYTHTHTHTPM